MRGKKGYRRGSTGINNTGYSGRKTYRKVFYNLSEKYSLNKKVWMDPFSTDGQHISPKSQVTLWEPSTNFRIPPYHLLLKKDPGSPLKCRLLSLLRIFKQKLMVKPYSWRQYPLWLQYIEKSSQKWAGSCLPPDSFQFVRTCYTTCWERLAVYSVG